MTDFKFDRPISRPLSEISENDELRRRSARVSSYSSSISLKGGVSGNDRISRPASEVLEEAKRVSLSLPVHTITLNLADYTGTTTSTSATAPKAAPAPATATTAQPTTYTSPLSSTAAASLASSRRKSMPLPPKLQPAQIVPSLVERAPTPSPEGDHNAMQDVQEEEVVIDLSEEQDGVSPLFMATRAALRPVGIPASDVASLDSASASINTASPPSTANPSLDLPRSSTDTSSSKPAVKSKPGWLRRASMTPSLRSKARSPAPSLVDLPPEPSSPHFSTATPPALPPRQFPAGPMDFGPPTAMTGSSQQQQQQQQQPPPLPPRDIYHPTHHSQSLRDVGRRWRTGGGVSRSASNSSIASVASTATTSHSHQRFPSTATRVLGHAGKAVSSTWNRARGVGTSMSISGMTTLGPVRGMEPEPVSPGLLTRKLSHETSIIPQEGLVFGDEVVKRKPKAGLRGRVFGRDLGQAGRAWGVFDADQERKGEDEYHRRRRQCLPAVVIRCVDYLETIGRLEEGIFRISGRSSHLGRLRKEFDAGADLDLTLVDPSDLDPHAIAGTFKSYLRELPDNMIPPHIEHRIEAYLRTKNQDLDELAEILGQLPSANWFLLADVMMLIDLIPRSIDINRMSHQALMLSLGPTLRVSGEHAQYFVRHRERLFANPPAVSPREMVDFGDEEIPPLSPMYSELSFQGNAPVPPPLPKRSAPKVSKRPSFGNLLASARSSAMRKSQSDHALLLSHHHTGPVAAPAPRLALPEPLQNVHNFENIQASHHVFVETDPDETEELHSSMGGHEPPAKASDHVDDHHYAPGTVAARARVYSVATGSSGASGATPIADRFRRSSATVDNLGGSSLSLSSLSSISSSLGHNSGHSTSGFELQAPPNSMVTIRRSPPVLFSSTVTAMASEAKANAVTVATDGQTQPASKGIKRKDDEGAERTREGDRDSAKRLSAGPGVLGVTGDKPML
ncbi:hypothetical protein CC85DRAFT_302227 [Cutaneotrichosporon oleaginosum]|uniref:Rho-GAP domain-containing protein n=1 Tax=Cutaneotrichosporon oleaginosum TaxID=879819 RepID=A0A0J0XN42_9TREE|nr:uncharacterized protein CC85DRAFT_302227 [Cutaneotrichosporon oleaginosum]KLT42536.1 hypothetical protein CC85DRAFT_302227 [Cutaneotrichosporon oleaginosum]TXT15046.1 hypothetical protein COLE_01239 [Cutaneotrichosporon oleaginosum]